ncbi:MAG: EamA family transporter RarD [Pseudomonadota bacterium]
MSTPADSSSNRLDPGRAGATAVAGYVIWGVSPIFYKWLEFAGPSEVVLHRVIWSAPLLLAILWFAGRTTQAFTLLADRKAIATLALTALLIGFNWWLFVYAITVDRVLEVSLGYFINPLMNVAVGVIIARERFGRWRALAVGLAALGVINLVVSAGVIPWIGLALAVSFTGYAYLRKTIATDGRIGLFWETLLLLPLSLIALVWMERSGGGGSFLADPGQAVLLIMTGPMTVLPLLFFIIGARGLHFATIGILQFIAPSLQFATGIAYGEPFTSAHAVTFALIWSGLAVFVFDLLRFERQQRRASST